MKSNHTIMNYHHIKAETDNPTINSVMGLKEWGLVILLSIVWGGSFFFAKVAVKEMTPLTIVLSRVGFASLALLAFIWLTGKKMPSSPGLWGAFIIMGALNNLIPFSLIFWGLKYIESSLASILNATTPIFSVVLTHILTREERLTANRITGALTGWVGVAVLIGLESLKGFDVHVIGQVAVLGGAFSYALAAIYGRRFKKIDPVVVATGMLCGSTIMMIPMTFIVEQPWNLAPGMITWAAILGLSVISTSLAYIIYFRILATSGPTNLLLVTFIIPVIAILLGVMVLGEKLGWNVFGGMTLIFLGLIAIDGRMIPKFGRKKVRLCENC